MEDKKYFEVLFSQYKKESNVLTELINLEAILNLPKGTEHYMSDIHGEACAFEHILRNGAGNVKEKIRELFGEDLTAEGINQLALLIYYPEVGVKKFTNALSINEQQQWYQKTITLLIKLTKYCSIKYTRSKLRKALPEKFVYVIEELIYNNETLKEIYNNEALQDKNDYCQTIINKLIEVQQAQELIIGLSKTISRLVVDHLHIVGDIFDRGPAADRVMDILLDHHSLDIQWGNHDILWLGAYCGSKACLLTLLRIAARYNYLYEIENAYGLNLRSLFSFADHEYGRNKQFCPTKRYKGSGYDYESLEELEKVHQALTIMQFKLEGGIIKRRPEFEMEDRLLLEKIDESGKRIFIDEAWYELEDTCFQTIDFQNPHQLTDKEEQIVETILRSFQNSEKMQRHMQLLLRKGSMYLVYNGHLLFHGCIPLTETGEFLSLELNQAHYHGKKLLDKLERHIRKSAQSPEIHDDFHTDLVWYVWSGKKSPLFGKDKMTTFERYFIRDKDTHIEKKNPYYVLREQEKYCCKILEEFGLTKAHAHIINGHTPVMVKKGETPVKAGGKLIIIDGGMSKAYQKSTGIGGYTLLNNSYGFRIVTHQPFISVAHLFEAMEDDISVNHVIDKELERIYIKDTTVGEKLKEQVRDLERLLFDLY